MRFIAAIALLSSFSAFACPNLAGNYTSCRSTTGEASGSSDVVITQTVRNGATVYTMTSTDDETQERNTEEMIADGVDRTHVENDPNMGEVRMSVRFTCAGQTLTGKQTVTVQGQAIADMNQTINKVGQTLQIGVYGMIFGADFSDTLICE